MFTAMLAYLFWVMVLMGVSAVAFRFLSARHVKEARVLIRARVRKDGR